MNKMAYKTLTAGFVLVIGIVLAVPSVALAHVVVRPTEVETAARQVFTVGVPNESKSGAQIVNVRLVIPDGLESTRPNSKPGWNIEVVKSGEGESARVSEIIWSGGSVPTDQRDEFLFQSKAPVKTGELQWKSYETYSDGTVVAWEDKPSQKEGTQPYSVTKVITPVKADQTAAVTNTEADQPSNAKLYFAIALGAIGIVLSGAALVSKRR